MKAPCENFKLCSGFPTLSAANWFDVLKLLKRGDRINNRVEMYTVIYSAGSVCVQSWTDWKSKLKGKSGKRIEKSSLPAYDSPFTIYVLCALVSMSQS